MKKLLPTLALALAAAAGSPATSWASIESVAVVVDGRQRAPITAYKIGSVHYIHAKQAGQIYGSQVYWYPASGRVQMSFRGRPLRFLVGSRTAEAADRTFTMEDPVLLRAGQAFIPMSIFLSEKFVSWAGVEAHLDKRTRLLSVDRVSSVGPVRWFSYPDHARLIIPIREKLSYQSSARGRKGVVIGIPGGVISALDKISVSDPVLANYELRQEMGGAKLSVVFGKEAGDWRIQELSGPRRLALDVFRRSMAPAEPAVEAPTQRRKPRLVIDAGHGGKDNGTLGVRGTREKDINLSAAMELAGLVREEGAFEVVMTRKDDSFISLGDRSKTANDFNADLFISLHCNASAHRRDTGFEIYFLSEKASDPEAERLAEIENSVMAGEENPGASADAMPVLVALAKAEHINEASELAGRLARALKRRVDLADRGVKQADFYVLRGTNSPAVLVEMGYLSNSEDEPRLESSRYRRRVVDGLYAGLVEYAKKQGWLKK